MNVLSTHPLPRNGGMTTGSSGLGGELFDDVIELPNDVAREEFEGLVGLDGLKARLNREGQVLLRPSLLDDWVTKHHSKAHSLVELVQRRCPLFLFEGDVGTGKTVLARTFGDGIARENRIGVRVFVLSLNARGSGAVGEMTRLISAAFAEAGQSASSRAPVVLLIDEADSLAQSRGASQMHHEDRAGVNALIRGLDGIRSAKGPMLVVMCTNRIDAIDPAIRRRAAGTFQFHRPSFEQRRHLLELYLGPAGFEGQAIESVARETGEKGARKYGFTYSDLTQRLLPTLVLEALPDSRLEPSTAIECAVSLEPTPPFKQS